jgi:deoxyribonuclease-1
VSIRLLIACLMALGMLGCKEQVQGLQTYQEARQVFWDSLYPVAGRTLYCDKSFLNGDRGVNVEHVFPMSWVTRSLNCGKRKQCRANSVRFNQIEADLHNLYPALSSVNQLRSSYAYAQLPGAKSQVKNCHFEVDENRRLVEPNHRVKGDIARAMFYMAKQYQEDGLKLFQRQGDLLLKWHLDDPASEAEKNRNQKIKSLQGNSNPFIDDAKFAKKWWETQS